MFNRARKIQFVVLLKKFGFAIKSGIEQRDAAIKMGAKGATTLLFKDGKFVMPADIHFDSLGKEPLIHILLTKKLTPEQQMQ